MAADFDFVAFEAADLSFVAVVAGVFRFVTVVAGVFRVVTVMAVVAVVAVVAADFRFAAVVSADFRFVAVIVSMEVKAAAEVGLANIDTVVSFVGNNLVEFAIIEDTLSIFEAFVFGIVIVDAFVSFTFSVIAS